MNNISCTTTKPSFLVQVKDFHQNVLDNGLTKKQKMVANAATVVLLGLSVLVCIAGLPEAISLPLCNTVGTLLGLSVSVLYLDYKSQKDRYSTFANEKDGSQVYDKDVFLILKSEFDHNASLKHLNSLNRKKLEKQKKYTVVCKEVKKLSDIEGAIHQMVAQKNRIHILELLGHGSPNGFILSNDEHQLHRVSRCSLDTHVYLRNAFKGLEKDATIILNSCSTGKIVDDEPCIGQTFADFAPGRTVIAPIKDLNSEEIHLEFEPLQVKFTALKEDRCDTVLRKIKCAFWVCVDLTLGPKYSSKNITARFRNVQNSAE